MPRVLFVTSNTQDYLSDGVLHGLRTLLGADAVDFPKSDYMYDTFPDAAMEGLWGKGFTLYRRLPDIELPRHHVFWRALEGEFELVVFSDIWRTFGLWAEWGPRLHAARIRLAVLDGSDTPEPYPYGRVTLRRPAWWLLPRAHNRARSFKREITPATRRLALGRTLGLRPISFAIPEDQVAETAPAKTQDFPAHIVDPELAARLGGQTGHAFATEDEYVADLRNSRFGITAKRAGWDAMRHYEIAASGAVPCFRDLDRKPPTCAPFGLDGTNSITYSSADELLRRIGAIDDAEYGALQAGALRWARANTTVARARELLAACGIELR